MLLTNNDSIKEVILFPSMKSIQAGQEGNENESSTVQEQK
jgi:aspartyl-tRNA synthetase